MCVKNITQNIVKDNSKFQVIDILWRKWASISSHVGHVKKNNVEDFTTAKFSGLFPLFVKWLATVDRMIKNILATLPVFFTKTS